MILFSQTNQPRKHTQLFCIYYFLVVIVVIVSSVFRFGVESIFRNKKLFMRITNNRMATVVLGVALRYIFSQNSDELEKFVSYAWNMFGWEFKIIFENLKGYIVLL